MNNILFSFEGIYDGQSTNGLANGYGKMIYSDGDTYIGEWKI